MASTAPAYLLQAAIDRLMDQGKAGDIGSKAPAAFIESANFRGAKPGYYFGTGDQGVGYYKDAHQPDEQPQEAAAAPTKQQLDPQELLRQAEEAANIDELQLLDARGLRRLVASFERKHRENLELRMKYADQPDKFLDSEVDLDEQIKSLMQVASVPELYPDLLELNVVPSLCALLSHENTDILGDVIELISELTGADAIESNEDETRLLVESLLEHSCLELLLQRLPQLDEANDDEASAVHNLLSILENMVEVKPEVRELVLERTKLLRWLLARIGRARAMDSNKLYASELLAVLLHDSAANQRRFAQANGIDTVLVQAVAPYRKDDPKSGEEEEFLQNCFALLCSCLMVREGQAEFHKSQGIDLMVVILKGRRMARYGALKTIDFATTRFPEACERFIDQQGLARLFPIFMCKNKVKGPAGEHDVDAEVEERCVSIISNLFYGLAAKGERRQRLAAKFVEAEFEKCDRLLEVLLKYQARVEAAEARFAERQARAAEGSEEDEVDDDDLQLARMDAGLYILQQCCLIVGNLWAAGDGALRRRVVMLLHQQGRSLGHVKELLLEFFRSIGDDGEQEEAERRRRKVSKLLTAMGVDMAAEEEALAAARAQKQQQQQQEEKEKEQQQAAAAAAAGGGQQEDMDVEMEVEEEGQQPAAAAAAAGSGPGQEQQQQQQQAPPPPSSSELDAANGHAAAAAGPSSRAGGHMQREDTERSREPDRQREDKPRNRERSRSREYRDRDKERERERDRGDRERQRDDKQRERQRERDRERDHRDREREHRRQGDGGREERRERSSKRDRDDEYDDYRRSKR